MQTDKQATENLPRYRTAQQLAPAPATEVVDEVEVADWGAVDLRLVFLNPS
jgi:hypothetical protein